MQWRACIAIALGIGCGSVPATPDASTGGGDAPDTDAPPPPPCDVNKPFGTPMQVLGIHNANANDKHATLTADEKTIFFASDRDNTMGIWHIYTATRSSPTDAFSGVDIAPGTYSAEGESHPSVSPDGNTIFYDSFRVSAGLIHIFWATRLSAAVAFPAGTMIAGDYLMHPGVASDGNVVYTASIQSGFIYRLDKQGSGWSAAQQVNLPNTPTAVSPVTNDDLTLFVSLGNTSAGMQVAVSKRSSTSMGFSMAMPVAELDTGADLAEPSWLSPDGCRLYLTYKMGAGKQTIFVATRPQ
jgi:hypothetical protein